MHELSIAMSIVEIAETECRKAGAERITSIELEVGNLSGVIVEALEFAMQSAVHQTFLEKAQLIIHQIAGQSKCLECNTVFGVKDLYSPCPSCGSYHSDLLNGKELRVKSLDVV